MVDIQIKYGSADQPITITLNSLTNGSMRESTAVPNTSNLFLDTLVGGKVMTGTVAPSANTAIIFYAYGTVDGGTLYSGNATGTDAAFTGEEKQLFFLGSIIVDTTTAKSYECGPWSVATAFGGTVPASWGIIVKNSTGQTLHGTAGNFDINYQGVYYQSV